MSRISSNLLGGRRASSKKKKKNLSPATKLTINVAKAKILTGRASIKNNTVT
jgi:hypothetical protein